MRCELLKLRAAVQAREVSPLTSCDQEFTPTQLVVFPQRRPHAQNGPTWVVSSSAACCAGRVRWAIVLTLALLCAAPAHADDQRLDWPLRPPPAVARGFDAPSPDWHSGHRGVDLSGTPGQPVFAAGSATVVFARMLAGRPVVSLAHPGGLRTSYEPVRAVVRVGQPVTAKTVIGELEAGHIGCRAAACLHWGAMWGPASGADYVDPLGLLTSTPIRLKPLNG